MRHRLLLSSLVPNLLASLALIVGVCLASSAEPQPPQGFTFLFNGKDLSGWQGLPRDSARLAALPEEERKAEIARWTEEARKHWKVDNGELVYDGKGAFLATDKNYGDIEMLLDYKSEPVVDVDISLRGASRVRTYKPAGVWNRLRIVQVGERTTVYLNDKPVVDHARLPNVWKPDQPLPRTGPIQLQPHNEVRWRNVFVREIPAAEANEILRKHGSSGFVDVFNGKDFTGWAGPVENYEVKDGAIVCKPKKGGTIYTTQEYSDFAARVEFKLPPGGNNGLAIRYPGKGDTAYVGMCELQVLDDSAKQYARLDPRQYHGSAYGMVAAQRGYQRPVGEWNFQEVTIKGPTIKVELNGTVILDTDLSKVTEYMAKSPHPGKDRTSGHFGFAGHSDPVAFRAIQIKPLDPK